MATTPNAEAATTPEVSGSAQDLLHRLGASWFWFLAVGIITLVAGVLALAWPGKTLTLLAVVFGIQLIVHGVFRLVAALSEHAASSGSRALSAVLGILSLLIGIYSIRHLTLTLVAFAFTIGLFWIVDGVATIFTAVDRGASGRGLMIASGVLSIIAGILVQAWPGVTLWSVAIMIGIWLILLGAAEIAASLRIRKLGSTTP